jgi:zinc metalloprotease ZmpB
MRTTYDPRLKATVRIDDADQIRGINHLDEYREMEHLSGREAATAYVREIAQTLNIAPEELRGIEQPVSYFDPQPQNVEYRFSEEKPLFDTATYAFYQTYLNTPVWEAGITATLKQSPARILGATITSAAGVDAKLPSADAIGRYRQLFETGTKAEVSRPETVGGLKPEASSRLLADILGNAGKTSSGFGDNRADPRLNRGRFFIYRYDPAKRIADHPKQDSAKHTDQPLSGNPPTLPLPPVPESIREGSWYLVAELVIRLPLAGRPMNWRLLVEVETNAILYLRALISQVNGMVFLPDPITATGNAANSPAATSATLNPVRVSEALLGLIPPAGGANQALTGNFVQISDFEPTTVAPPTEAPGTDFNYDARTDNFAAVNAYHHADRFFRLVQSLGFTIATYFDGTTFPVPVDHRGRYGSIDGIEINASCSGDGDGIANVDFELADMGDLANPIGIAADWRVVLHELGGHGILYDHVNSANFGFSHSAGDSVGVILNDPTTLATDRFESFPWVSLVGRRHDRTVAAGWGWGGPNDDTGYSSEQILATTMFRVYRSIGGDSADVNRRQFASRSMVYLLLRAVGTLTPMSNPGTPALFLAALLTADAGDWTSEGVYGGAYGKVFTWSFEKQNLNAGAKPPVDVYIDDGRAGEYTYQPVHWATTTIWNQRDPTDPPVHAEPALGVTNYAYVKIKNRGTSIANNVIVKGFHSKPSAGVFWPNDLQPFTTAQLTAGTLQPNNTEEKVVGPFEWTPVVNAWGHDCMFMIVSATGDPSNVNNLTAGGFYEDWRLVPNDNNIGQRNVTLAPGGGGLTGLMAGLEGKGFWLGNPTGAAAKIAVSIKLPPLLESRGWRINLRDFPAEGIRLKPREQKLVTFHVLPGESFNRSEARAAKDPDIVVTATADGAIIGGMVYRIDPELEMPFNDRKAGETKKGCLWMLTHPFAWLKRLLGR